MRKSLFVLTLAVLLIAISTVALAADVVKIGIFEPMTGPMAVGGALGMQGYELAQDHRPTVLGKTVELILVDNKSDKVESASAVSRLIEKEGVVAILGSYGSSCSIPGGEVADKAGIPMLAAGATNPLVTFGKDYVFRCCFIDPFQGEVMARYTFENLGIKNRQRTTRHRLRSASYLGGCIFPRWQVGRYHAWGQVDSPLGFTARDRTTTADWSRR